MSALLELAQRCEAASGPVRLLDAEIFAEQDYGAYRTGAPVPAYTASLDAAMTLVPEGHDTQVNLYFGRAGEGAAVVSKLKQIGLPRVFAATPALALCAAGLRARAAIAKATSLCPVGDA